MRLKSMVQRRRLSDKAVDLAVLPLSGGTVTGNLTVNGSLQVGSGVQMNSTKISGLATPTEDTDAVTKAYVDSLLLADLTAEV